jgi:hypothetical protein
MPAIGSEILLLTLSLALVARGSGKNCLEFSECPIWMQTAFCFNPNMLDGANQEPRLRQIVCSLDPFTVLTSAVVNGFLIRRSAWKAGLENRATSACAGQSGHIPQDKIVRAAGQDEMRLALK